MFFKYILKTYIKGKVNSTFADNSSLFKGLKFYRETKGKKKSLVKVYRECKNLYDYWDNSWPDTYFRFAMFMQDFNDWEKIKSFVPQQAYYKYCKQSLEYSKYNILIDDKIICHDILSYYHIPVTQRFFIFRNNEFRCKDKLLTDEEVDNILFSINDDIIFVKYFTGGAASGISVLAYDENEKKFKNENKEIITAKSIKKIYSGKSIIFEKKITQHPILSNYNPETVNTIRVLTYDGKVIAANIRFGRKGNYVDNTAKGGIAISLNIETGEFGKWGMREYELEHYFSHPDSDKKFEGTILECWSEAKKLVEKVARFMPYYRSVGFDVAITITGPIIIEINTGAGIYLSQMGNEYGLGNFFKGIKL